MFSLKVTPPYVNPSVKLKGIYIGVPSINKSFHSFTVEPISCLSSSVGISDDDTLFITITTKISNLGLMFYLHTDKCHVNLKIR